LSIIDNKDIGFKFKFYFYLKRNWCQTSFDHFNNLIFSSIGAEAGISQVSGYQLFNDPRPDPSYKDIVYNFRYLTKQELGIFPDHYK
jgi:hypothetical protein